MKQKQKQEKNQHSNKQKKLAFVLFETLSLVETLGVGFADVIETIEVWQGEILSQPTVAKFYNARISSLTRTTGEKRKLIGDYWSGQK